MHSNSQAQPFPPMTREELEQIADDFGNVGIGGYGQWIVPARLAIADIFRVFATARLAFSERETPDQRQPSVTDGGHIELNEDDQVAFVRVLGHGEDLRDDPRISDLMVHLDEGPITAPQDVERFLDAAIAVTPPTEASSQSETVAIEEVIAAVDEYHADRWYFVEGGHDDASAMRAALEQFVSRRLSTGLPHSSEKE